MDFPNSDSLSRARHNGRNAMVRGKTNRDMVWDALEGTMTARQLAQATGISIELVRCCLTILRQEGRARMVRVLDGSRARGGRQRLYARGREASPPPPQRGCKAPHFPRAARQG
jgi:hypothetical protein